MHARAYAGEALSRIHDTGVAERAIAAVLADLGEAEFLGGQCHARVGTGLISRAWALQHLAAVTALSADLAAPDRRRIGDAARILGYVDARVVALGTPRERTEQQEDERVRTALRAVMRT